MVEENSETIACVIMEPIVSSFGYTPANLEYLEFVREITTRLGIVLIYDEVQTGIGITGKMWAHETLNVKPDIISFGKKTQVCGMLAGDRIYNMKENVFKESSRINSTFGGNLVDMYRFKLILEIMCNENLFSNVNA